MKLTGTVSTVVLAMLSVAPFNASLAADDACTRFKWDVAREVALHRSAPTELTAAVSADRAPAIRVDTLYQLQLQPQESLQFVLAPTRKQLAGGASGGLLTLRVAQAGAYRVAIDSGFWIDVLRDGAPLATLDFNGSADCPSPRKIVVYDFPPIPTSSCS